VFLYSYIMLGNLFSFPQYFFSLDKSLASNNYSEFVLPEKAVDLP
jgi:hypothetical protein